MSFEDDFEALCKTYTELLLGQQNHELVEKIKIWSIYNQMHKTMPALTNHWNKKHPQSRAEMRKLFEEIKMMNEVHRKNKTNTNDSKEHT